MNTIAAQVPLIELDKFVSKVKSYPISVGQLLKFAETIGAPKSVKEFYKRFARDRVFESPDDLAGSSEIVEIMREESEEMPQEEERSPEEY